MISIVTCSMCENLKILDLFKVPTICMVRFLHNMSQRQNKKIYMISIVIYSMCENRKILDLIMVPERPGGISMMRLIMVGLGSRLSRSRSVACAKTLRRFVNIT